MVNSGWKWWINRDWSLLEGLITIYHYLKGFRSWLTEVLPIAHLDSLHLLEVDGKSRLKPLQGIQGIFVGGAVDLKTHIFLDALPIGTARFCAFLPRTSVFRGVGVGWGRVG